MKADLHSHTTYSDGSLTVQELINLAIEVGLDILSITDHDCLDGSLEALTLVKNSTLKIIPGIELSTIHNDENIHILGYFKDDFAPSHLEIFLEKQRTKRNKRGLEILKRLHQLGITLDETKLIGIKSITRGTIADLIIESGYYYTKQEIFDKYLGEGAEAYIPSTELSTQEGIKLLKSAGAITVLAHPVNIKKTNLEVFIQMGIDGLEAIYPTNTKKDTFFLLDFASRNKLLVTGGSDFHHFDDYKHGNLGSSPLSGKKLIRFLNTINER